MPYPIKDPNRAAAVQPFGQTNRVEYAVTFMCWDWIELFDLFHDPVAYLKAQSFLWGQDGPLFIEWQLLAPATAFVRYGGDSPAFLRKAKNLASSAGWAGSSGQLKQRTDWYDPAKSDTDYADALSGSFLVNFCTYTSVLQVIYFPPATPTPFKTAGPKLTTPYVLHLLGQDQAPAEAALHVDITGGARERAEVLFRTVSDPNYFAQALLQVDAPYDQGKFPFTEYSLTALRTPLNVLPPADPNQTRQYTFMGPSGLAKGAARPTLTVHDLSVPVVSQPCTYCTGTSGPIITASGQSSPPSYAFSIETVDSLSYQHAQFDSQSAITGAVNQILNQRGLGKPPGIG